MTALPPNELIARLDGARSSIVYDRGFHHYPPHHHERSTIDTEFDDLIDFIRAHMDPGELDSSVKDALDPSLEPGDCVKIDGRYLTVRAVTFHAPFDHKDSPLPNDRPVMEIVTGGESQWYPLVPGK